MVIIHILKFSVYEGKMGDISEATGKNTHTKEVQTQRKALDSEFRQIKCMNPLSLPISHLYCKLFQIL